MILCVSAYSRVILCHHLFCCVLLCSVLLLMCVLWLLNSQKADLARETAVHLRMQVERSRNEIHTFEDIILQTKKELEILKRDKEL